MRVLAVDPARPRADRLEQAVAVLSEGHVVALPTETFYGLAADIGNPDALSRINRLKGKPKDAPMLVLLSDAKQVEQVAGDTPPLFHALGERFWPGPLTLVIPASARVSSLVGGGRGTVAVRVPGMALPRNLACALGRPITGVSANIHGAAACRTAREVADSLEDGIELILDGGATRGGAPSTVLDLSGDRPRILRAGLLPASSLEPFVPDLVD